jgi:hypothetical protein
MKNYTDFINNAIVGVQVEPAGKKTERSDAVAHA